MAASDRFDRVVIIVGGVVLAAYVVQARYELVWPWLAALQADDTYKVVSGLGLSGYLLFQWFVASRRQWDPTRALWRHKLGGALAPVALYLHASRFAYGYLCLLGLTYLIMAFVGLLNRPIVTHARSLFTAWFVVHVSTAAILVILGGYHVVIALAYE